MQDACCHEMMNTQSYWWAVMSVLPIVSRIRHFKQQFLLRHYIILKNTTSCVRLVGLPMIKLIIIFKCSFDFFEMAAYRIADMNEDFGKFVCYSMQ